MFQKITIDTTYILPSVGVKVKGLPEEGLDEFFKLMSLRGFKVIISDVSLIEALGKALKHAAYSEKKMDIVEKGYLSILTNGLFQISTHATPSIFEIALDLRRNGLEDLFDCLITGTAIAESDGFITEDAKIPQIVEKTDYAYFPISNLNVFKEKLLLPK